jgi:hypothetical protein
MKNRIEIKGKNRAFEVAFALLESGYSVLFPQMTHDEEDNENNYFIIEYTFTKYDGERFKMVDEDNILVEELLKSDYDFLISLIEEKLQNTLREDERGHYKNY